MNNAYSAGGDIKLPPCPNEKVPEPAVAPRHFLTLQTRFNDIDMLGHINNSVYLSMMDLGKAAYFEAATGDRVEKATLAVVIVNINCDFYSPGYLDEPLAVATTVVGLSDRSMKMEQRVFNRATGDVKCVATTILAGFNPMTARGIELPGDFVAKLENYENRPLRRSK